MIRAADTECASLSRSVTASSVSAGDTVVATKAAKRLTIGGSTAIPLVILLEYMGYLKSYPVDLGCAAMILIGMAPRTKRQAIALRGVIPIT